MLTPYQLANTSEKAYLEAFAELYEHSSWVVLAAFITVKDDEAYVDLKHFHTLLSNVMLTADVDKQNDLIKQHPMLAFKHQDTLIAKNATLTRFSSDEQKSAGLSYCSEQESNEFANLNAQYIEHFGFPFIMAVKGKHKQEILTQFNARLDNTPEAERQTALAEINKIAWLRLQAIYEN